MTTARKQTTDINTHGTLSEKAYQLLRDGILRGVYPLGAVLSRRNLAEELGMSFLPVSEALQRLESDGLVESKPRVGTRVRIPTPQDIREHCIVREALESQAARLFAEKASPQERLEVRKMGEQLDKMYLRTASGKMDADFLFSLHALHVRLHVRIAECTGCTALREAIGKNQDLIFNWLIDSATETRIPPARFHRELVAAVCGRDPEVADAAMRKHIRHGLEETLQRFELRLIRDGWRLRGSGGEWLARFAAS